MWCIEHRRLKGTTSIEMQSCFNVVRKRNPREAVRNLPRPDDHYDGDDDDDDDDVGDDGEYDDRDIDEDDWR